MEWLRINVNLLDSRHIQTLPASEFRRLFMERVNGADNVFTPFVRKDRGRPSGKAWASLRAEVFERDGYTCTYCGLQSTDLECDHIMPISRGGMDNLDNLTTACASCNASKQDRTPEEWGR